MLDVIVDTTLDDICYQITDGKHGDCQNEENSGYYFLSAKDVRNGKLNYDGARQITSDDFAETHRRTKLEPRDILITNSGTIGRMAIATNSPVTYKTTFQKSVAILKPRHDKVEAVWLYYYLHGVLEELISYAGGTAQKNLLLRDLRNFKVALPPIDTQRRIAAILSAYDDLIENNNQRIQALEAAAQALYREWFVELRFPGWEDVEWAEQADGSMLPVGWEWANFNDLCASINSGGTPRTKVDEYWGGGIPWLSSGETRNRVIIDTERTITALGVEESSTRWVRTGATVIASAGQGNTRGQTSIVRIDTYINQSVIALTADTEVTTDTFVFLDLARRYDELRSMSDFASTRGSLTTKMLKTLRVIHPPRDILRAFDNMASPIIARIEFAQRQNIILREARDLLLPRLISGELSVEDAPLPESVVGGGA